MDYGAVSDNLYQRSLPSPEIIEEIQMMITNSSRMNLLRLRATLLTRHCIDSTE